MLKNMLKSMQEHANMLKVPKMLELSPQGRAKVLRREAQVLQRLFTLEARPSVVKNIK